jgi:hypothetical protein
MSDTSAETPWTVFFKPTGASVHSINVSERGGELEVGDEIKFGPMGMFCGTVVGVTPSRYKISADDIPAGADPVEWIKNAVELKEVMA